MLTDINLLLQTIQEISSELDLNQLFTKIIRICLNIAKLERCSLILNQENRWIVATTASNLETEISLFPAINPEILLPKTIIDKINLFQSHNHAKTNSIQSQTVNYQPLITDNLIIGVLIMKAADLKPEFTLEKAEFIQFLAPHIAIALNNAIKFQQRIETESKIKQMLEGMPLGVAVLDHTGKPYYLNQKGRYLLGQDIRYELNPEDISQVYQNYIAGTNEIYPAHELPIVRALRGESCYIEDLEIRHHNEIIPVEAWGTPIYDDNGQIIYALVAFQDITHRREAEAIITQYHQNLEREIEQRTEELRESQQKFRSAFTHTVIGMCLVSLDRKFIDVNRAFCQILGYSEAQLLEMMVQDITYSEDLIEDFKLANQLINGEIEYYQLEKRYIRADGSLIWALISVALIRDSKEQPLYFIGQVQDITQRKQAETAIRNSEIKLNTIVNHIADGILIVDQQGFVQFANPSAANMLHTSLNELNHYYWGITIGNTTNLTVINSNRQLNTIEIKVNYIEWDENPAYLISLRDITHHIEIEESLRHSEETNRALLDGIPDMMFRCDIDGTFLDFKPAKDIPTLVPSSVFMGNNVQNILPPTLAQRVITAYKRAIESKEVQTIEYELEVEGKLNYYEVRIAPCGEDNVISMVRDITQRHQGETALATSLKELSDFKYAIDQASIVAIANTNGVITYVNDKFCQISQYNESELLGKKINIVNSAYHNREFWQNLWSTISQGQVWRDEIRNKAKNGTYYWLDTAIIPFLDENGKPTQYLSLSNNISDRKRREQALHLIVEGTASTQGQDFFYSCVRSLAEVLQVPYAFISVFSDKSETKLKTIAFWGENGFVDNIEYDVVGTPCEEVIKDKICYYSQDLQQLFPQDDYLKTFHIESYLGIPLNNSLGEVIGNLGVMDTKPMPNNVDQESILRIFGSRAGVELERQQAEIKLEQAKNKADAANKAKSEFLANMSHELRTPLNAILGFAQLLQKTNLDNTQKHHIDVITRSGEHLLNLINDILDLSKIEAGCITLNPVDFNLYYLVSDLQSIFQPKAKQKNLSLEIIYDHQIPSIIYADQLKLRQILINLLNNAIKFTHQGTVTLRIGRSKLDINEGILVFSVQDTGIGIAPDDLSIIFDAFSQTQSGLTATEGTGLGLAISSQFVKILGGELSVTSEVGQGTTFEFTIPLTISENREISPENTPSSSKVIRLAPNQPEYRLLVVDDRWTNRELMLEILEDIGFIIKEAANGREAVQIWQEFQPDLVWMDMRMPIMDGYEAIKQIRAKESLLSANNDSQSPKRTVIIALTASAFVEEQEKILAVGCDDIVRKPIEETTILDKIAQYLGVSYLYQDKTSHNPSNLHYCDSSDLAQLKELPVSWLAEFTEAIKALDITSINSLIEQIEPNYPNLANKIKICIDNFEYRSILTIIEDK